MQIPNKKLETNSGDNLKVDINTYKLPNLPTSVWFVAGTIISIPSKPSQIISGKLS
jgi:hypothetical protein